ncbi:hypothetical protein GSI_15304 [Ganoderma sinense ZZ0214-1]|uniref:GST N-terminal domain-containing protein n=1 Tax=Ganoderma sinense ZZ0214-1 TaxID=1077348 RepID=A0A2G8RM70_9APHY|nr:hypothetical protein GSI_15304 [Ganoderma sinense ZZ0214-1]
MVEPIVLYEIPGTPSATAPTGSWNPNCWKTRYTLNIKALPYRTVWVEYPDIETLYKKVGAEAVEKKADGSPYYTLPAIYDPNTKKFVAESAAIARYLDKAYPESHTIIPQDTDALHAAFAVAYLKVLYGGDHLRSLTMSASQAALRPPSAEYFLKTREAMYGSFDEFAPKGSEKRGKHWEGLREIYRTLAGWLEADGRKDRLFFMGERISFADVSVAGFLWWIRRMFGEESDEWKEITGWDEGRWKRFMDAFAEYEAVDVGSDVEL